jgi:hypothetical protein
LQITGVGQNLNLENELSLLDDRTFSKAMNFSFERELRIVILRSFDQSLKPEQSTDLPKNGMQILQMRSILQNNEIKSFHIYCNCEGIKRGTLLKIEFWKFLRILELKSFKERNNLESKIF